VEGAFREELPLWMIPEYDWIEYANRMIVLIYGFVSHLSVGESWKFLQQPESFGKLSA
jgi:hypothetical protein